jgi:hypothetical protein
MKSCTFNEAAFFNEAAEILLMEANAHERFHNTLELEQCKGCG